MELKKGTNQENEAIVKLKWNLEMDQSEFRRVRFVCGYAFDCKEENANEKEYLSFFFFSFGFFF